MCFRPASTTMGARICMKCHYVCDDVSAEKCPQGHRVHLRKQSRAGKGHGSPPLKATTRPSGWEEHRAFPAAFFTFAHCSPSHLAPRVAHAFPMPTLYKNDDKL